LKKKIGWLIRDKYAGKINGKLEEDVIRLKKGEPVDYVIGWKPFLNCRIDLSQTPLIPRPETEHWTEKAIEEIGKRKGPVAVADIFGGSGCIGLAVLKNIRRAKVDFGEIEPRFLRQIRINLRQNKIEPRRYRVIRSDIFKGIDQKYDFILANPPYVGRRSFVEPAVRKFEPAKAIFAGDGGLAIIEKFLKEAPGHLKPVGQIWMEFGDGQKKAIAGIMKKREFKKLEFLRDQYGKYRTLRIK